MKITDIETVPVFNGYRNFLFVLVHTDAGISGIGESGLSGRELAVQGTIEHFKDVLIGQDARRIEHLWQVMARGAFFPAAGAQSSAMSAIDIALWDIKGKALGVPVYELLGGLTRDKVLCYAHVREDIETSLVIERCLTLKAAGWRAFRAGPPLAKGLIAEPRQIMKWMIDQFAKLREAVGPDFELIIDAHTRIDLPEAMRLCRELEAFDPYFVEDPLRSEDAAAYRVLRQQTIVPLAAGEQYGTKWAFRPMIEEELIDYCRLDPCLCGGITESKKIAAWCEAHHIRLAVHNPIGPVATAACLHFNLSCPNVGIQEQPAMPGGLADIFPEQMKWQDGYLLPPTKPGLGIEINLEAAKKYPGKPWEPPQVRRLDGSMTNW